MFLARKSNFLTRERFSTCTTSVHAQITLPNFSNRKTGIPLFHSRMCQATFSYGDPRMEAETHFFKIPVWKQGFPISIWGCVNPRFHMGIPVWKRFWRPKFLAMQWRLVRDSMAGQNYSPHFHTRSPHVETHRQKKFPFGDSPFPNRVCVHLWINIYVELLIVVRISCESIVSHEQTNFVECFLHLICPINRSFLFQTGLIHQWFKYLCATWPHFLIVMYATNEQTQVCGIAILVCNVTNLNVRKIYKFVTYKFNTYNFAMNLDTFGYEFVFKIQIVVYQFVHKMTAKKNLV